MRKTQLIVFLGMLVAFSFSSCKKNRTCSCEWLSSYPPYSDTDPIPLDKMTSSEAADSCNALQVSYDNNPYYTDATCTLQ